MKEAVLEEMWIPMREQHQLRVLLEIEKRLPEAQRVYHSSQDSRAEV